MKKKSKTDEKKKPSVNKELTGFDITINSFGERKSAISIDDINAFLDQYVEDKKLKGRKDESTETEG